MRDLSLSLLQSLHMVALLPCLFVVGYLLFMQGPIARVLLPCAFFVALSASFINGLLPVFFPYWYVQKFVFVWVESLQPAICFLLIIQLWRNALPPLPYWLILAVPIFGGTSLVIAEIYAQQLCISENYCLKSQQLRHLYQFFATAFIFLLLIVHLGRLPIANNPASRFESHRYWVIMALVLSYAALMLVDLLTLTRHIELYQHDLIHVVLRISFMYLIITSLFRLLEPLATKQQGQGSLPTVKPVDGELLQRIDAMLTHEKLYREMSFSREQFARKLEVGEHILSRAINQALGKNFNELVNGYRVEEAKQRLASEATSVTVIAFEVGFSSIASFNRVFKAMVGQSPTEYRQININQ